MVCRFESENHEQMIVGMGKAMKCTRFWLKKHGLIADGFFLKCIIKASLTSFMQCYGFRLRNEDNIKFNAGGKTNEQVPRRIETT